MRYVIKGKKKELKEKKKTMIVKDGEKKIFLNEQTCPGKVLDVYRSETIKIALVEQTESFRHTYKKKKKV